MSANSAIEEYRHQCEVRFLIVFRRVSEGRARDYLDTVEKRRGAEQALRLRLDAEEQKRLGNNGKMGVWKSART